MVLNRYMIIGVLVALVGAYEAGRYSGPDKVTHVVAKTEKEADKKAETVAENQHVTIQEVKAPDGTVTTNTTIDTDTKSASTEVQTDTTKSTDTTVTENRQGITFGPLIGLATHTVGPIYGMYGDKQLIGPIHVNATFLTSPTFGLGGFIGLGIQLR